MNQSISFAETDTLVTQMKLSSFDERHTQHAKSKEEDINQLMFTFRDINCGSSDRAEGVTLIAISQY